MILQPVLIVGWERVRNKHAHRITKINRLAKLMQGTCIYENLRWVPGRYLASQLIVSRPQNTKPMGLTTWWHDTSKNKVSVHIVVSCPLILSSLLFIPCPFSLLHFLLFQWRADPQHYTTNISAVQFAGHCSYIIWVNVMLNPLFLGLSQQNVSDSINFVNPTNRAHTQITEEKTSQVKLMILKEECYCGLCVTSYHVKLTKKM